MVVGKEKEKNPLRMLNFQDFFTCAKVPLMWQLG